MTSNDLADNKPVLFSIDKVASLARKVLAEKINAYIDG
jgi:hypothetical protein